MLDLTLPLIDYDDYDTLWWTWPYPWNNLTLIRINLTIQQITWFLLVSHIISMFLPIQVIVCPGTMGRLLRPMIGTMTTTSITTTARTAPSPSMERGGTRAATTPIWTGITRILHLAKASTGMTSPATTSHWTRWRWNWGGPKTTIDWLYQYVMDIIIMMMCRR